MNIQAPEKAIPFTGTYEVNTLFNTIQGEGPFAGTPATFIRLAGCNLQCTWCDTEYTHRMKYSVGTVVNLVGDDLKLVVISGGEPFRQKLAPLVNALLEKGKTVQIETNGTIFDEEVVNLDVTIVVSPKTKNIDKRFFQCHNVVFKYLFGPAFPSQPEGKGGTPSFSNISYIMPLDTSDARMNKFIIERAIEYCIEHDVKLTLQTHKILGIA